MPALNSEILYLFFGSANMHRWNDHLRPVDLTELDKQAHKAAIAWVLGKFEESDGKSVDWRVLIEHCMFSFIQRVVLTDLKPAVFYHLTREKRDQVNAFVLSEFDKTVPEMDPAFRARFEEYLHSDGNTFEDDILRAAHYLATRWEFNLIYDSNRSIYGIEKTREEIQGQIVQHVDLVGVRQLLSASSTFNFIDLMGQLRFQQRWARAPRIPQTTVLGHSLMVADMMFLHDLDAGVDDRQLYNDFFSGLFHDVPEVLTKDVISPIKAGVDGLAAILEDYERELVESRIMPLLMEDWRDGFRRMVYDPFTDIDDPVFGRRDGYDLKACDMMAAFIEAYVSRCYGIGSRLLGDGEEGLREKLRVKGNGIGAQALIEGFESMRI